jgi:tetratricopeptide (TPR) repeat protein
MRSLAAALLLAVASTAIAQSPVDTGVVENVAPVESAAALYERGCAAFRSGDYNAAGRALARLAPFDQPRFGLHARYLLARCHDLLGEGGEALTGYDAVAAAFPPDSLSPELAALAALHAGILHGRQGRHDDAIAGLQQVLKRLPADSPLVPYAQLHTAVSQVSTRRFADAIAALTPLREHPKLGPDACRWSARALIGKAQWDISPEAARPAPVAGQRIVARPFIITTEMQAAYDRAMGQAVEHLQRAVAAGRTDLLFELADAQSLAGRHTDAAATFAKVSGDPASELRELAAARLVAALQLCGKLPGSDAAAKRFISEFPRSGLAGEVMVRTAENALHAGDLDEAARRFQAVLAHAGEDPVAVLARQGLAAVHYRRGDFEQALAVIEQVPESDRVGELVTLSCLHADVLLRTLPRNDPDDALASARMRQQIDGAIGLLTGYTAAREGRPEAVEGLVKLAHAYQRQAALLDASAEKRKSLSVASRMHRLALLQSPEHAVALLESARIRSQLGDGRFAERELARFQSGPLQASPLAPVALIHLGDGLRLSRKPEAAAQLLTHLRQQHEPAMLKDPAQSAHVPVLRFALALALKDAARYVEAQKLFDSISADFPTAPEAIDAAWRSAQCQRDIAASGLEAARRQSLAARTPQETTAAEKALAAALDRMRSTADALSTRAVGMAEKLPSSAVAANLHYDAAHCWRAVADVEAQAARKALAADPTRSPLEPLPPHPAEARLRESYGAVIDSTTDSTLAADARIELAELHLSRSEFDPALKLLAEGLEGEPPQDAADRLRLKLGAAFLQRGGSNDARAAAEQFQTVATSPQGQYAAFARVAAGEALFLQRDFQAAADWLQPLVQRNAGPLTDRGLLRLAQSWVQLSRHADARTALEALLSRFRGSPLAHEARFGLGWIAQQLREYDKAIAIYSDLLTRVGGELAAKAQFHLAECRAAQQKTDQAAAAYLEVASDHNYSRWAAAALQRIDALNVPGPAREAALKHLADMNAVSLKGDAAPDFLAERLALWTTGAASVPTEPASARRPAPPATRPADRAEARRIERETRREQQRLAERRRLPVPPAGPGPLQITTPIPARQRAGGQPSAPAVGHLPVADERGGVVFPLLTLSPRPWAGAWLDDALLPIEQPNRVAAKLPADVIPAAGGVN